MNLTMYPVYNPKGLVYCWPFISKGLKRILSFSNKDTSMTKIFNELMSGELLLWIIYIDHEYKGFMTTKIEDIPEAGRNLWIVHLYATDLTKEILIDGLARIEEFARSQKCDTIRFLTMREEPFERRLNGMGFKKGYTEFIKELNNG